MDKNEKSYSNLGIRLQPYVYRYTYIDRDRERKKERKKTNMFVLELNSVGEK